MPLISTHPPARMGDACRKEINLSLCFRQQESTVHLCYNSHALTKVKYLQWLGCIVIILHRLFWARCQNIKFLNIISESVPA